MCNISASFLLELSPFAMADMDIVTTFAEKLLQSQRVYEARLGHFHRCAEEGQVRFIFESCE